jgi:pimeloyl-ACP methyl ester carboxylesterase
LPAEQAFALVNGARLYYELAGEGPPLVFIHGYTLDHRMWDDQLAPFAAHYRVLRYDVRGFGRSSLPTEPYSSAQDLKALLDHLAIPRAHIVGLSAGGGIAIDFALAYPEATASLIAVDAALNGHTYDPDFLDNERAVRRTAREDGVPAARARWLASPLFAPAHEQRAVAARLAAIIQDYSGWHWLNRDPATHAGEPAAARLADIRAPTLVFLGERDLPDFHHIALSLATRVPNARKITLPTGHMANMEAPTPFNEATLTFLSTL